MTKLINNSNPCPYKYDPMDNKKLDKVLYAISIGWPISIAISWQNVSKYQIKQFLAEYRERVRQINEIRL